MTNGKAPALLAGLGGAFRDYFIGYGEAWGRYGILFAVLICGSLLLQAQEFMKNGGTDPLVYSAIVLSFLTTSTAVSLFKLDKISLSYNQADQVAWYLGTKKPPPWYLPLAKAILIFWVVSFLGVVYLDQLVLFTRLSTSGWTLPAVVLNLTLVAQFAIPIIARAQSGVKA